jgi:hypothetical protein
MKDLIYNDDKWHKDFLHIKTRPIFNLIVNFERTNNEGLLYWSEEYLIIFKYFKS